MNVAAIVGRLTADPKLHKTSTGKDVCSFTVAVRGFNDKSNFIPCVAWNKAAEIVSMYCVKGSKIGVNGRIESRSYDKDNGEKVYVVELVTEAIELLDKKPTDSPSQTPSQSNDDVNDGFNTGPLLDISSDDLPF